MPSYVYLLLSSLSGSTYVGATINLDKRLRQHNKELVGGAIATGIKINNGEIWERVVHVQGFPDWKSALQFEWRWKQISRKYKNVNPPIKRRIFALKELLSLERSTTKAIPYCEWELKCNPIAEIKTTMKLFSELNIE